MTFADSAARLAGLAAKVLGWTPETFWSATPQDLLNSLGLGGAGEGLREDEVRSLRAMMDRSRHG